MRACLALTVRSVVDTEAQAIRDDLELSRLTRLVSCRTEYELTVVCSRMLLKAVPQRLLSCSSRTAVQRWRVGSDELRRHVLRQARKVVRSEQVGCTSVWGQVRDTPTTSCHFDRREESCASQHCCHATGDLDSELRAQMGIHTDGEISHYVRNDKAQGFDCVKG